MNTPEQMNHICANCGCTYGSHHAGSTTWPYNYCPGHENQMDWDQGPGTVFKKSGKYKNAIAVTDEQEQQAQFFDDLSYGNMPGYPGDFGDN